MSSRITLGALLTAMLAACGGGGGDGGGTATATPPETPAPATIAAPTTVASLVPGTTMTWTTRTEQPLVIELKGVDGRPAAGAGVRIFTMSRSSPQDGAPLDSPVPMSLLDSAVSDSAGRVAITLALPGHVDEVLVTATLGDMQGQRAVAPAAGPASVVLAPAR